MTTPEHLVDTHLAGYAEPDAARRAALLAEAWRSDGTLVDPPMDGTGPEGIAALTDVLLEHYPEHSFRRTSTVDVHHDHGRYSWELVGPDGVVAVSGLDVARFEDGRIASIVGFFGELTPAAA